MHLFYQPLLPDHLFLPEDESRHAVKVLRLGAGDPIEITDGKGALYDARISDPNYKKCGVTLVQKKIHAATRSNIHICIAPVKNADRTEWLVEKAVELGVDVISFMQCDASERKSVNLERLEKLAVSAMKQSRQFWLPLLNPMRPFPSVLFPKADQKFIAYVDSSNPVHLKDAARPGQSYCVLIGPEGDFTREELQRALDHGFQKVSLGQARLRTETAGLAACLTLGLVNQ